MAKIPRIEAGVGQIRTVSPTRTRLQAPTGNALQTIGQTIAKTAKAFEQVQSLHEVTRAKTEARLKLSELKGEAQTTEDIFNLKALQEKIPKIRESASKGVSLPLARQQFASEFDLMAVTADFNIRSTLRKRQSSQIKADIIDESDSKKLEYIGATDERQKLLIKKDFERTLSLFKKAGHINPEAAKKLAKASFKEWDEAALRTRISEDADKARDDLLAGSFPEFSADETAKWIEVAEKKIKKNQNEALKAREDKWLVNTGKVLQDMEGTSTEDLIQMVANDQINPQVGNDLIEWKLDPKTVNSETDKEVWKEIARDSMDPETDLRTFQASIAKALRDKKIKPNDAAELSIHVNNLFKEAINFKSQDNALMRAMRTAFDAIKNAIIVPQVASFFAMKELINKIKGGLPDKDILPEAKKLIDKNNSEQNPNVVSANEKGQLMMDAFGNKALVFPDGSIQEVE